MVQQTYNNQTLGRGELRFSRINTSTYAPLGFRYVGNSTQFSMTVNSSMLDHYSMDHGIQEKNKSVPYRVDRTAKFDLDDINLANLGYFFYGDALTVTQTSTTANEDDTWTSVGQGFSYPIGISAANPTGMKNVTNVVVKVGTTAQVAGTDYVVDTARGIVTVLMGGAITNGSAIKITYDTVASSFDQVISGNVPIVGAIQFIADNPEGANIDYTMRYVRLTPNGDFALKAENAWQSLPFTVEILRAPGLAAIYANGQPYTS